VFGCKWFQVVTPGAKDPDFWYWKNQFYPAEDGEGCCSETSVAFHYLTAEQVSISFNFFEQVFHTKLLCADFHYLQSGIVIFLATGNRNYSCS